MVISILSIANLPQKIFGTLTGFEPMASAYVSAAVHFQLVLLN